MTRRTWRFAAPLLAVCLGATACSASSGASVVAAPGVRASDCGDVRIAVNPWVGYDANVAVVSYLLRKQLSCKVSLVPDAEADSWTKLAAGKVDVILENWGHDEEKKKYIDTQKVAVEAGLTGNKGVIGWYVPKWMVEQYPGITQWKNLNGYSSLFTTPESEGKGQLLLGDPTYVTNDKALVKNLGLDYSVVYAGSEDKLIAAFRAATADRTPLIGYFYSPQWLLSEVDLEHVKLPTYTPGCDADPKTVKCDYQPYDLDKIMNREFAYSGSPAVELVTNFQWTDEDQNEVARSITEGGLSADQAAKKWLDANPSLWRKWLPSTA